ncbi:hypothetical protein ECG_09298 [Echinococcus granulosus]|nr:hypothetical protein ECG_09298 [Echinococcus granulosus]
MRFGSPMWKSGEDEVKELEHGGRNAKEEARNTSTVLPQLSTAVGSGWSESEQLDHIDCFPRLSSDDFITANRHSRSVDAKMTHNLGSMITKAPCPKERRLLRMAESANEDQLNLPPSFALGTRHNLVLWEAPLLKSGATKIHSL